MIYALPKYEKGVLYSFLMFKFIGGKEYGKETEFNMAYI